MPLDTFPDVDYPLWGNGDTSSDKFKTYNVVDPPVPFTVGTVISDLASGAGTALKVPIDAVKNAASGITETVRNGFLYLIGGGLILGILAIVALGAVAKVQAGGK